MSKQKVQDVATMETLPTKELANSIDGAGSLAEKKVFAAEMIQSGLLPETLATPSQLSDPVFRDKAIGAVIAVVEYGRELNITPWVALNGIHVVQGKTVMGVHMYLGLALRNDIIVDVVDDYIKVFNDKKQLVDIETTIEITRKYDKFDGLVKTHRFTKRWSEIKKAGLDQRDNYKKRGPLMLRTRCITEGLRLYAADLFMGTYETSEMLDVSDTQYSMDEDGTAVYEAVN